MSSMQDMPRVDRELFSELIESPINPAFLHMSTPLKGYDPVFHLQINGEALWKWHVIKNPDEMFQILQFNLYQIGYQLSSSCRKRVGLNVYSRMHYVVNKVRNANGKNYRDAVRAQYWCTIMLHTDDLSQAPADELVRQNERLSKELEGKASELYDAMLALKGLKRQDGHKSQTIDQVGQRQQQRHLKEMREKAQKALWFAETYGLSLKSLVMEDPSGCPISIDFMSDTCSSASDQNKESYANLDDEEKELLRSA